MTRNRRIQLTDQEMADLDDGQQWYEAGEICWLGGYEPDEANPNPGLDLYVTHGPTTESYDNWTYWSDLPLAVRQRLAQSED